MKVVSTNIAKPQTVQWKGKLITTGIFKEPVNHPLSLGFNDVVGDHVIDRRFHGGTDKACYLYSVDHYHYWKEKYQALNWRYGMFGENLTMENLDEKKLFIGDIYTIGGAKVQISQPRQPCFKLGLKFDNPLIIKQFISTSFSGSYVKVLEEGTVSLGDQLVKVETSHSGLSIAEVFNLLYQPQTDMERVNEVINNPFLPNSTVVDLKKKYKLN